MLSNWQKNKEKLRGYIKKRVDDEDIIDDLLQEIYIKASMNFHQLKARENFDGWLYRIAHNTIMDFYRKRPDYTELPINIVGEEQTNSEKVRQELVKSLQSLIEKLPEKYRIPLQLAELEGISQQEIAERLGLSLSGAKSRVQRGRVKLREEIAACCDIEVGRRGITDCTPKDPNNPSCASFRYH